MHSKEKLISKDRIKAGDQFYIIPNVDDELSQGELLRVESVEEGAHTKIELKVNKEIAGKFKTGNDITVGKRSGTVTDLFKVSEVVENDDGSFTITAVR